MFLFLELELKIGRFDMDLIAHLAFGLWLYKIFGNPWVIPLSCIIDIDHIFGYIYDKRNQKNVEIPNLLHLAYRPRTWIHSITGALLLSLPLVFFLPWKIVLISIFSHIVLDSLDILGIYTFPPFTNRMIHGIFPVGYLLEDPNYLRLHKRSHIASIIFILLIALLIFVGR